MTEPGSTAIPPSPVTGEPMVYLQTQAELAKFFGFTERTVRTWMAKGCPPKLRGKGYDIQRVREWLEAHGDKGPGSAAEFREDKLKWDAKKSEWDAKIKERQYELLDSAWFTKEQVQDEFESRLRVLRASFETLPKAAARDGHGAETVGELEQIIAKHRDQILGGFALDDLHELLEERKRRLEGSSPKGRTKRG